MTIQEQACEYSSRFELARRDDGTEFWRTKTSLPEDETLRDLIYAAHGDKLPDDFVYEQIVNSLDMIADASDGDELDCPQIEPDVYNNDRLKWLSSRLDRAFYVDEAVEEGLVDMSSFNLFDAIGMGQYREKEEIYFSVLQSLREIVERGGETDDEAC